MPYRHAYLWLLAIFPLIAIGYWPSYFSVLGRAPFSLHAHAITASAWLLLLVVQSWSIQARNVPLHRSVGMAMFVVLPLFAAAGPLALQGLATLWRDHADPFHATFGARLVATDVIAGPAVIAMATYALLHRRHVVRHAAGLLATALLVLPPVIGRIFPHLPGFPDGSASGWGGFRLALQLAEGIALVLAIRLALQRPAARFGFGFAAAATLAQMIAFETVARTAWWERMTILLTRIPTPPLSLAGGLGALALLLWAWRRGSYRSPTDRADRTVPPLDGQPA